jgi:hypothetical protein
MKLNLSSEPDFAKRSLELFMGEMSVKIQNHVTPSSMNEAYLTQKIWVLEIPDQSLSNITQPP